MTKQMAAVCCLVHASPFGQEINSLGFLKTSVIECVGVMWTLTAFHIKRWYAKLSGSLSFSLLILLIMSDFSY